MTERETPTTPLRSLTPEQFLAQFADEPDHGGSKPDNRRSGAAVRRTDESRGFGPVEGDDGDGGEAWSEVDERADDAAGRLDGDETYRLSTQFAVPESAVRPPLPPTPSAAGRDRKIPPIPPRSMLKLSNDLPADS